MSTTPYDSMPPPYLYLCPLCGAWLISQGIAELFGTLTTPPHAENTCPAPNCGGVMRLVAMTDHLYLSKAKRITKCCALESCGRWFSVTPQQRGQRFCSRGCANAWKRQQRGELWPNRRTALSKDKIEALLK